MNHSIQTDPKFLGVLGLCLPPKGAVPSKIVNAFAFCLAAEVQLLVVLHLHQEFLLQCLTLGQQYFIITIPVLIL